MKTIGLYFYFPETLEESVLINVLVNFLVTLKNYLYPHAQI